jgi:hypothetical protein
MSHSAASPANAGPFSATEIAEFRADDKGAAAAIVVLMVGIFSLGLIGYLGVCWWVS